ncbi:MAG: sodium-dependent transporter [Pontibacterium sp.]
MDLNWKANYWHSRALFVLASLGGSIGLGTFWRFPDALTQYGGSAFLLLYFALALLFVFPMLFAQVAVGRSMRKDPIHAIGYLLIKSKQSEIGAYAVFAGMIAAVVIVVVAATYGAWVINYLEGFVNAAYTGITPSQAEAHFNSSFQKVSSLYIGLGVFMCLLLVVSAGNMHYDLFWAIKVLVPLLLCGLVATLAYSAELPFFVESVKQLLSFNPHALSLEALRYAASYAFYTFLMGTGVMVILGSYMPQQGRIDTPLHLVIWLDLLFAVMIAIVLVTVMKAFGGDLTSGPALIFVSLPSALGHLPNGQLLGVILFSCLLLATWTSAQLLLEPCIAWLEERYDWHRYFAALALLVPVGLGAAGLIWVLANRSYGQWVLDVIDVAAGYIVLPLSGLAITWLIGWRVKPAFWFRALRQVPKVGIRLWLVLLRFFCPLATAVLMGWNLVEWLSSYT